MKANEWEICAVCGHTYQAVIPRGGDGSQVYPRKHTRRIPVTNNMSITILPGKKEYCPGSFIEPKEPTK